MPPPTQSSLGAANPESERHRKVGDREGPRRRHDRSSFQWSDPGDERDPMEMLSAEGSLVNGNPDPARELSSDDLQTLVEE